MGIGGEEEEMGKRISLNAKAFLKELKNKRSKIQ